MSSVSEFICYISMDKHPSVRQQGFLFDSIQITDKLKSARRKYRSNKGISVKGDKDLYGGVEIAGYPDEDDLPTKEEFDNDVEQQSAVEDTSTESTSTDTTTK